MIFCMTPLNTICQNMKLKLVKNDKNFVKILELLGDRLEVCVSVDVYDTNVILLVFLDLKKKGIFH